jgi:hypothetical protein
MLRESSTSTAIIFCCDFSSATVIAGSHSSARSSATIAASIPQIAHTRQFRTRGAASGICLQISHASPPIATAVSSASNQPGHAPSRMYLPLVKTGIGYLKKNSNMPGRFWVQGAGFEVHDWAASFSVEEQL